MIIDQDIEKFSLFFWRGGGYDQSEGLALLIPLHYVYNYMYKT